MSSIFGYKAFNGDFTNRYGQKFELNKIYTYNKARFGKRGFYFCSNLEDTLRYFDGFSDVLIAYVRGFGNIRTTHDEYNGFYDIHVSSGIEVKKIISREEILNYMLNTNNEYRINRFINLYKLTEEEINILLNSKHKEKIHKHILYYQYGKKDAFKWFFPLLFLSSNV